MHPDKACAVLLSPTFPPKILLFRHPQAGVQLVKGTIESGETPGQAALRELMEEAGITRAVLKRDLGHWDAVHQGQVWSFQLCEVQEPLAERWSYQTHDDHGHVFNFFWASFDDLPYDECHPVFQRALVYLRNTLPGCGYTLYAPRLADIDALLRYLPDLYPEGVAIKAHCILGSNTWPTYADVVDAFFREACKEHWTHYDYRRSGAEARLQDPAAIAQASLAEIQGMLTYCVRGERFCDGHWASMIEQGCILKILNRLASLRKQM